MRRLVLAFGVTLVACHTGPYPFNPEFTRAAPASIDTGSGTEVAKASRLRGTVADFDDHRALRAESWSSGDWVLIHFVGEQGLALDFRVEPAFDRYLWLDLATQQRRELTVPGELALQLPTHEAGAPATLVAPLSQAFFRVEEASLKRLPDAPVAVPDGAQVLVRRDGSVVFGSAQAGRHVLARFDGATWSLSDLGDWYAITLDDQRVRLARWEPGQLCVELRSWPALTPMGARDCVFTSLFTGPDERAVWHGTPDEFAVLLGPPILLGGWSQLAFFFDGALHAPEFQPIGSAVPAAWPDAIAPVPGQLLVWNNLRAAELRGLWRYAKGQQVEVLAPVDTAGRDCACDRTSDLSCTCLRRNFTRFETQLAQSGKTQVVVVLDPFEFEEHLFVKTASLPRRGHLFLDFDVSCQVPQGTAPCGTDSTSYCAVTWQGGRPACVSTTGRLSDPGPLPIEFSLAPLEGVLQPNDTGLGLQLAFAPGAASDAGPKYPTGYLDSGISDEGTGFVAFNPFDAQVRATLTAPGYEPVFVDVSAPYVSRSTFSLPLDQARKVFLPKGRYVPGVTAATSQWVSSPATGTVWFEPSTWLQVGDDGGLSFSTSAPVPAAMEVPFDPWCWPFDRFMRALVRQVPGGELVLTDFQRRSTFTMVPLAGMTSCFAPSSPVLVWRRAGVTEATVVWSFDGVDGGVSSHVATLPSGLRNTQWVSNDGERLLFHEPVREDGGTALHTRLASWSWRNDAWVERGLVPAHVLAAPYTTVPSPDLDALLIVGPPLPGSSSTASSLFTWYPLDGVTPRAEVANVLRVRPSNSPWLLLETPQGLRRFNPRTQQNLATAAGWNLLIAPNMEPLTATNGVLVWNSAQQTAVLDIATGTVTQAPNATMGAGPPGTVLADGLFVLLDEPRFLPATASGLGLQVSNVNGVVSTSGGGSPQRGHVFNTLQSGTTKNPWGLFGAPCEPRGGSTAYRLANYPEVVPTSEGQVFCVP